MNILYFGDPLIDLEREDFINGIIDCSTGFFNALKKSENDQYSFTIISNEYPADKLVPYSNNIIVKSDDLLKFSGTKNRYELVGKWFSGKYGVELLERFEGYYSNLLKGYTPDVIFTLSPVPYLQKLFPEALILHHEASVFTRYPFELSIFFDPVGLFHNQFYEKYHNEISRTSLKSEQKYLVDQLIYYYQLLMISTGIFNKKVLSLREKFDRVFLIPLDLTLCYLYDPLVKNPNPVELLNKWLQKTDPSVGVIVTIHPSEKKFYDKALKELENRFPNFIYSDENDFSKIPSNNLIPFVDAVGCGISKVGLHTKLLDSKLISLGATFKGIADNIGIEKLQLVFEDNNKSSDSLLYWMATRYAINAKYIFSEKWLPVFVERSLLKFRQNGVDSDFFDEIDNPAKLLSDLIAQITRYIPNEFKDFLNEKDDRWLSKYIPLSQYNSFCDRKSSILKYRTEQHKAFLAAAENEIENLNYNKALILLEEILKEDSNNIDALNDKAVVFIMMDDFENAIANLNHVLEIDTENELAKNNLQFLKEKLEQVQQSKKQEISEYEENLSEKELILLAEDFIEKNNFPEALSVLSRLLQKNENNVDALNDLSVIYIMQKNYSATLDTISRIFAIDLNDEIAKENLNFLNQEIIEIKDFNPDNLDLFNDLSVLQLKIGNYRDALKNILEVLVQDPMNPKARNVLYNIDKKNSHKIYDFVEHKNDELLGLKKCNLCSSNAYYILTKKSHHYYTCRNCGVVFTPEISPDVLITHNNGNATRNETSAMELRLSRLKLFCKESLSSLVDFGCGNGQLSNFLKEKGFETYSIDTNTEIQLKDINDNSIDAIFMIEVIEHINEPLEIFHEFHRILKDEGVIYVESSFVSNLNLNYWTYLDPAIDHSFVHSEKSVRLLAEKIDLSINKLNDNTYVFKKTLKPEEKKELIINFKPEAHYLGT